MCKTKIWFPNVSDKIRMIMINDTWINWRNYNKSETSYESPEHSRKRLGMDSSMKNILISITLRALDRTLKKECLRMTRYLYKGWYMKVIKVMFRLKTKKLNK
jgi:hypothetical protein